MDRDEFMDIVYSELESDSDNNRANRIIYAADEYVESTQFGTKLAEVGTDCISRRRAIDAVVDELDVMDAPKWAYDSLEGRLKQLPPVTPKQRTGYWYPVGMVEAVGGESAQWGSTIAYHKCSECDEQALRDDFEQEVLSDFCPHCGCRMEGMSE